MCTLDGIVITVVQWRHGVVVVGYGVGPLLPWVWGGGGLHCRWCWVVVGLHHTCACSSICWGWWHGPAAVYHGGCGQWQLLMWAIIAMGVGWWAFIAVGVALWWVFTTPAHARRSAGAGDMAQQQCIVEVVGSGGYWHGPSSPWVWGGGGLRCHWCWVVVGLHHTFACSSICWGWWRGPVTVYCGGCGWWQLWTEAISLWVWGGDAPSLLLVLGPQRHGGGDRCHGQWWWLRTEVGDVAPASNVSKKI